MLSNILIAVGVALLLVAGGLFVKAQIGYKKANDYYNGIAEMAVKDSSGEDGIPQIDFDALKKESDDIVGWIYVPGTRINYVVAQGETNNTYLRHLPNGEYSENGTIFMDMDGAAPGMVDQQTTLYGHHMNDGAMFEPIDASMDQKVFDTFKKVYYITPEMTYVLKPMFTMQVQDDYVDARRTSFDSEKAFTQYLQASLAQAKASAKDAAAEVEKADKVLTLVTCAGQIIPRTTRAGMVCRVVDTIPAQ
ncbi:MAG: class B sortase [Collinsella intestinalis]|uniref:Class B sortase n=1 Tax=Collinsella intestinalis TaxID=147207 RepID=A0A943BQU5_9ACTN|nr:class B sortase [Collinsella intestinalis]